MEQRPFPLGRISNLATHDAGCGDCGRSSTCPTRACDVSWRGVNELEWSWFCLPYAVCALVLVAVGLVAALVRGDQVLRLGTIGSAFTALPWAICSALATCTHD